MLIFAAAIGVATFIENDFGTSAAQKLIFQARWFELLLALFCGAIVQNIWKFRMIQQKKWSLLTFHAAILIIMAGAALTRYFGFEGVMHIREQQASNRFLSSNTYLKFQAQQGSESFSFDEPVLFASLGSPEWQESYLIGQQEIRVNVKEFMPNPTYQLKESLDGGPILKVVIAGGNGREEYFLEWGKTERWGGTVFHFSDAPIAGAVNVLLAGDSLLVEYSQPLTYMVMATQQRDTLPAGARAPLALRALYSGSGVNFVFPEYVSNGRLVMESQDKKVKNESLTALLVEVNVNGQSQEKWVYGAKGVPGRPEDFAFGDMRLAVSYGAKEMILPFSLQLHDFILERYPGTDNASSYASEVQLIDQEAGVNRPFRIYMNNILNYRGYRFFQSSFDQDEQGTYLSVNSDFWGSLVSYLGYALLTIGLAMTFFSKKTRFYQVLQQLEKIRNGKAALVVLMMLIPAMGISQTSSAHLDNIVSKEHAAAWSRLVVQDFNGRMKPLHTLSREVMRKVARTESIDGLTADQILLSMFINSKAWYGVPLVKLGKHEKLAEILQLEGSHASYDQFFHENGEYKLRDEVRRSISMNQADRGVFEKELLKIDERVNILNMCFSGRMLAVVPAPNTPNHTWLSYQAQEANAEDLALAERFFQGYGTALVQAMQSGNYQQADGMLTELANFQQRAGGEIVPSPLKIRAEIWLNQLNVFSRLAALDLFLALAFLFFLFYSVFQPQKNLSRAYFILFGLVALGFSLHTIGLGLRWYVSGRAPWSNGYESLIYIAWTTTLAGVLFTRKSFGGLAATMALAATILFVATLSAFDPEITPLVPVLKSYWLTIHVSLEAGSYGFLMLGAIIGLINLLLIAFMTAANRDRVQRMVREMSYLSELTLLGGLFMISVGTYLGGVWANESWGRYWGWDAKETWALVTILIYAFILHMRIIPKMTGLFAFNVATIFGLASVLMTYFGVNYYLSGLHSYASGDPVPVPTWVYGAVAAVVVVAGVAYYKRKKHGGIS